MAAAQTGADALAALLEEARTAVALLGQPRTPTSAAAAQTGADAPVALLEKARTAAALLEEARTAMVADGSMEVAAFTGSVALSPDRYRGYHGFQAVVRDVGPGGGWPTLTKTYYVEWAAVMRVKLQVRHMCSPVR